MTRSIVWREAAQHEFEAAVDWYETEANLGLKFHEAIDATLTQIAKTPEAFPLIRRDARRVLVAKFPYSIIYRVKADAVVVLAVFHHRRNPDIWRRRF